MAVAGDQLAPTVLDNGAGPEAVVFQLEHALRVVERQRFPRQRHRLKCHAESVSGGIAKGGRTHDGTCQLIQFHQWCWRAGRGCCWCLSRFAGAEFLEIAAFRAILSRTLPGDVPRVKTCRRALSPPEVAAPPARNEGPFPQMSLGRR
jgi:hypothetical protein